MDKQLILAVAGAGKTTHIIEQLTLNKKSLLITYTVSNTESLRARVIEKFGFLPTNIKIESFFTFLYSSCCVPYLGYIHKLRGINWNEPPQYTRTLPRTNMKFYLDSKNRIYSNRISSFLINFNVIDDIIKRLEKFYEDIYVDEVQDFGGYDYDFLLSILDSNLKIQLVGDFFQHTFNTSADGNKNAKLYSDIERYKNKFKSKGVNIKDNLLIKSHRCSADVCEFVRNSIGITIYSFSEKQSNIKLLEEKEEINSIMLNDKIVKLFYWKSYDYNCVSRNWGESKGYDGYKDVCVVLNPKTYKLFKDGRLTELVSGTKNKFYVACTRASGDLFFVNQNDIKHYKKQY